MKTILRHTSIALLIILVFCYCNHQTKKKQSLNVETNKTIVLKHLIYQDAQDTHIIEALIFKDGKCYYVPTLKSKINLDSLPIPSYPILDSVIVHIFDTLNFTKLTNIEAGNYTRGCGGTKNNYVIDFFDITTDSIKSILFSEVFDFDGQCKCGFLLKFREKFGELRSKWSSGP